MKPSFTHTESFPLVLRAITNHSAANTEYLRHSELVGALLLDPDAEPLIAAAAAARGLEADWIASNMVQFFSKRFEEKGYSAAIDRLKTSKGWAYRSRHPSATTAVPPDEDGYVANEGNLKLGLHLVRERDPKLAQQKRQQVLGQTGKLACECCGFDAKVTFAAIDAPIVEVHHRVSLSSPQKPPKTTMDDLAILCPTCHRAIHRTDLGVEEFKKQFFGPLGAS